MNNAPLMALLHTIHGNRRAALTLSRGNFYLWPPLSRELADQCDRDSEFVETLFNKFGERTDAEHAAAGEEYNKLYRPYRYSRSGEEMSGKNVFRVARDIFRLSPGEKFVDLGSSEGKLAMFVALATDASVVAGVELSSSRTRKAKDALARLSISRPDIASRLCYLHGDIYRTTLPDEEEESSVSVDLSSYNVLYCAVRPLSVKHSKGELISRLLSDHRKRYAREKGSSDRHVRLYTAGFDLESIANVTVTLQGGHSILPEGFLEGWDGNVSNVALGDVVALYGKRNQGPRVFLEYALTFHCQ